MPIHPTILLLFAGILYADPIPPGALVWSGTSTYTFLCCLTGPPTVTLAEAGANTSQYGMGFAPGLTMEYTVDTGFTVTGAGNFVLSSSGYYNDSASTCWPTGCAPPNPEFPLLDASFSASVGISDSNGNSVFGESLGQSGWSPYGNCQFGGVDCTSWLALGDSQSGVIDLAAGNYTLALSYYGTNDSIGVNFGGGGVDGTLASNTDPIPEPLELGFLVAGMAIVCLIKPRHRDAPV